MINQDIVNYFQSNSDTRKIPFISNSVWNEFIKQYSKDDIKDSLTEYIVTNNVPFPIKEIKTSDFENLFLRFSQTSFLREYKNFDDVQEQVDYRYKYKDAPLGVIDKSHVFNSVSNYFQQENRMKCGSNSVDSPWDIWRSREKLNKMNWHFWRAGALGKTDICDTAFRSSFRIGTYTATQFKPSVAKALYEKHKAKNVLDTSCGWGDRLAAFYATSSTRYYVGCDPNPEVFEVYKKQCIEYEKLLGGNPTLVEKENYFCCKGIKTVEIYNLPCEDINWKQYENAFDFYFTSPPYFETERYATSTTKVDNQSWVRYNTFDSWKNNFFFKVNRLVWDTLQDNAFMMINIIDPRTTRGNRLTLCDDMVEDILTYPNAHYIGKIGMRMQARPHSIVNAEQNSVFIEPIWVFRKNNKSYISNNNLMNLLFYLD
jgi:hypothetical protein